MACCTGESGYIWVTAEEIDRLAARINLTRAEFLKQRCLREDGRWSLIEKNDGSGDCTFLTPRGCGVYEDRPGQCKSYPFWPDILESKANWDAEAAHCPGINHGPVIDRAEIEARKLLKPPRRPSWYAQRAADKKSPPPHPTK